MQTANKVIRFTQELALFTKKKKEIIEVKHKRNFSFLEARRIVGSYMGESSYTSVAQRVDRTNDDYKYRTLVEKLAATHGSPNFLTINLFMESLTPWLTPGYLQDNNNNNNNKVNAQFLNLLVVETANQILLFI